jgi:serine/threonine protein phosphatase PrpC
VIAISRAFGDMQFKSLGSNLHDNNDSSNKKQSTEQLWPQITPTNRQDILAMIQQMESESLITAQPDIRSEIITPKTEFAVIASDGLWDVMAPQVVIRFVRDRLLKHKDVQKVCKELTKEALNNHSVDNISVVVVTFHSSFSSIQQQQP